MLDPVARLALLGLLERLHHSGLAIILITHYMEEVLNADRIIVLDAGCLALDGTPREVFRQVARLKEIGLDLPPLDQLAYGLMQRGLDLGTPLTVTEMVRTFQEYKNG